MLNQVVKSPGGSQFKCLMCSFQGKSVEQLGSNHVQSQAFWTVCAHQPKTKQRAGAPDGSWVGGGQQAAQGKQDRFHGQHSYPLSCLLVASADFLRFWGMFSPWTSGQLFVELAGIGRQAFGLPSVSL